MSKKVLVISTSFRQGGNSDILADEFVRGAKEAGHDVEKLDLIDKNIHFCKGCLACQSIKLGHCVIQDDADEIISKMAQAQVIAFATPIYFYEMSGQMKTLLDRTNPLFPLPNLISDIYLLASAAENEKSAMDGAIKGLSGWIDCFDGVALKGVVYGTNTTEKNDIFQHQDIMKAAYDMGKQIV